jgi:E3 ubiquitin-protein ligase RNF31
MKISRILGEGKGATGEKAELAKKLMDMNFGEEDSIYAATECSSLYAALSFLQQECDLCAGKFSARQVINSHY